MPGVTDLSGCSVLVLDDEFYIADDTAAALESVGATIVGPFGTAAEAIQAAEHSPPDCAVVDINLGNGPDFQVARYLVGRGVPVVFITGYDHGIIPKALAHLACIQKPAQAPAIIMTVAEILER